MMQFILQNNHLLCMSTIKYLARRDIRIFFSDGFLLQPLMIQHCSEPIMSQK